MGDPEELLELARRVFDGLTEAEITEVKRASLGCDEKEGRQLSTDTDNHPYDVRECRGHYHVTAYGEDIVLPGDPFSARGDAEAAMQMLVEGLTEPKQVQAPPRQGDRREAGDG